MTGKREHVSSSTGPADEQPKLPEEAASLHRLSVAESDAFDQALAGFAAAYADQNQRDFRALEKAVKSGRVKKGIKKHSLKRI